MQTNSDGAVSMIKRRSLTRLRKAEDLRAVVIVVDVARNCRSGLRFNSSAALPSLAHFVHLFGSQRDHGYAVSPHSAQQRVAAGIGFHGGVVSGFSSRSLRRQWF